MQDDGHLVLVQVELLAVQLLEGVLLLAVEVDACLGVALLTCATLLAAYDTKVFDVAEATRGT